jgi:hypothetical protein
MSDRRRFSLAIPNLRQFAISKSALLLLAGGVALSALALSRRDPMGPQSIICRHRDDPKGTIDFRVDVGRGDDWVRFADGQTLPVEASRDRITFLENETNRFHLSDNDSDEAGSGTLNRDKPGIGISAPRAPVVLYLDRRHDVEHRTTIDRHRLTFQEQSITKDGQPAEVLMDGRCKPVSAG